MTLLKMAAAIISSVLLAACGGGGDSTATPSTPALPSPSAPVVPTPGGCANGAGTSDCIFRYGELVVMVDKGAIKNLSALSDTGGYVSVGGTTNLCEVWMDGTNVNVLKSTDGRPIVQCQVSPTNRTRKNYLLHPENLTLSEYEGAIPDTATRKSTPFGTFGSSPYNSCAVTRPNGMHAIVGSALYYITGTSDQLMRVNAATAASTSCSGATPVPAALVQFVTAVSN